MAKFFKGEFVSVVDWNYRFTAYKEWFQRHLKNHDFPIDYAIRYKYGTDDIDDTMMRYDRIGTVFEVLFSTDEHVLITPCGLNSEHVLITPCGLDSNSEIYLFDVEGLDYIRKTMTLEEIENILGYHIEII